MGNNTYQPLTGGYMNKPIPDSIFKYVSPAIIRAVERHNGVVLNYKDIDSCHWTISHCDANALARYKGVGPVALKKCSIWLYGHIGVERP